MSIEAMKRWLAALEMHVPHVYKDRGYEPITSLRQAIEQAQKQEPVAWITEKISGPTKGYMTVTFNKDTGWKDARSIPLYEHPPQRQPLTDEQITSVWETRPYFNDFARAIEAAHGITGEQK